MDEQVVNVMVGRWCDTNIQLITIATRSSQMRCYGPYLSYKAGETMACVKGSFGVWVAFALVEMKRFTDLID